MDLSMVLNGILGFFNDGLLESSQRGGLSRRGFLRVAMAGSAAVSVATPATRAAEADQKQGVPYRALGRTGVKVSAIGMGGFHLGSASSDSEGIRLLRTGVDQGINFMDNCWDYHEGGSEVRMGKALRDGYRDKVFLMTKIDGRTKTLAASQIDESLRRLQTDHVDLMQVHEVIRMNDPDRVFAEGGAIEALKEAQKAGKIRFIGFTGHKDPSIHLHMLETARAHNFRFDTVQMPLNVMDAHFRSFEKQVLPVLVKEQIGILGMKPLGSGIILKSNTVTPIECLHYAMNLPTSVVITGIDKMEYLDQALQALRTFQPMKAQEVASLLSKTAQSASAGKFELFKTDTRFDATSSHPAWLG